MNSLPIAPIPRVSSHTFSHISSFSSPSGFLLCKRIPACSDSFLEIYLLEEASKASPNGVAQFLCTKLEPGWVTVYMEWCPGEDLQTEVENRVFSNQLFSADYLYDLAEQMLTTLNQLHSQRIAHRQICLRHWVLQGTAVKLIDFGSAKLIKRNETIDNHTLRNAIGNTSPEVLESVINSAPTTSNDPFKEDIWALGKVLYELATLKLYAYLNSKPTDVLSQEVQHHLQTRGLARFAPVILAMLAWGRSKRVTASEALILLNKSFAPERNDTGFLSNGDSEYHFELL